MSRTLSVRSGLDAPRLETGHALRPILSAALGRRGAKRERVDEPEQGWWDAEHHGLGRVQAYQRLGERRRAEVLRAASRLLLEESRAIEKLGLAFASKMVLLAPSTEERMLYSLFASDEASHLHQVEAFLPEESRGAHENPFLSLLERIVEDGTKPGLTLLIQVLLEGWGISHYGTIARECRGEALREALRGIVRDEALHHSSGVVLFNAASASPADRRFMAETLGALLKMVQAGPQGVAACLERACGGFTRPQRTRVFAELACEDHSRRRLDALRSLLDGVESDFLLPALEAKGLFLPLSARECARLVG